MPRLARCVSALAVALVVAGCGGGSSEPPLTATAAFDSASSTLAATQDLHILVQSHTDAGGAEASDAIESPGTVHLKIVSGSQQTELVIVNGNEGWERSPQTGGQWGALPQARVGGILNTLNAGAEAHCIQVGHGRLRSIGTRTFAKQHTRAVADDGDAPGAITGTWYLTQKEPVRIVGFTGQGPARPGGPNGCGTPGPGSVIRLYSYEAAPPVTAPPEVLTPPSTG
jgi:hypothetical protein